MEEWQKRKCFNCKRMIQKRSHNCNGANSKKSRKLKKKKKKRKKKEANLIFFRFPFQRFPFKFKNK